MGAADFHQPGGRYGALPGAALGVYTDWGRINTRVGNWDQDGDGLLTAAEAQWDLAVIGLQSRIGDVTGWVGSAATAYSLNLMVSHPAGAPA